MSGTIVDRSFGHRVGGPAVFVAVAVGVWVSVLVGVAIGAAVGVLVGAGMGAIVKGNTPLQLPISATKRIDSPN